MDHLIDDSDRTKPCPFCGGHASMGYVDRGQDAGGRYIACDTCGASTNLRFACGEDPTPLLLEQWNKRAGSKPAEQLGLAIVDAIADDGCRNAAGGIYATRVQEFAMEVQRAFARQNGLQVRGLTDGA